MGNVVSYLNEILWLSMSGVPITYPTYYFLSKVTRSQKRLVFSDRNSSLKYQGTFCDVTNRSVGMETLAAIEMENKMYAIEFGGYTHTYAFIIHDSVSRGNCGAVDEEAYMKQSKGDAVALVIQFVLSQLELKHPGSAFVATAS